MLRSNRIPLIILIVVFLVLTFFVPSYGWSLRSFLIQPPIANSGVNDLVAQNESLKAQLSQYQAIAQQLPDDQKDYTRAMVYSRYPMNFRNEFLVNAGTDNGVAPGQGVMIEASSSYVLVGKVISASPSTAIIQTVFDPSLKIAVRIGSNGYDALLQGGTYPKAGSIAKTATVNPGDAVYAADASLPYGVVIGEVSNVSISPDNLFQEAQLVFPYDINAIQTVVIQR